MTTRDLHLTKLNYQGQDWVIPGADTKAHSRQPDETLEEYLRNTKLSSCDCKSEGLRLTLHSDELKDSQMTSDLAVPARPWDDLEIGHSIAATFPGGIRLSVWSEDGYVSLKVAVQGKSQQRNEPRRNSPSEVFLHPQLFSINNRTFLVTKDSIHHVHDGPTDESLFAIDEKRQQLRIHIQRHSDGVIDHRFRFGFDESHLGTGLAGLIKVSREGKLSSTLGGEESDEDGTGRNGARVGDISSIPNDGTAVGDSASDDGSTSDGDSSQSHNAASACCDCPGCHCCGIL